MVEQVLDIVDGYDVVMGKSKKEDIIEMFRYGTRGVGFEVDNGIQRTSYFSALECAGNKLYNLKVNESKCLADVFWFGGVGYISGWANLEMLDCARKKFSDNEDTKGKLIMPDGLSIGCDNKGLPERRWFDKKNKIIFEKEIYKDVSVGDKCLHHITDYDVVNDQDIGVDGVCIKCIRRAFKPNWGGSDNVVQEELDKKIVICRICGEILSVEGKMCNHKNGIVVFEDSLDEIKKITG